MDKSCGNCVNCDKVNPDMWVCEEYGFFHAGLPVHCEPPYDGACSMWTDDPKKKNTWLNMERFGKWLTT